MAFDDGSLSSNFDLDRGDAQGNTPSPILYNMAQQIFLFKLELCPEIKTVFINHLVPRPLAFVEAEADGEAEGEGVEEAAAQEQQLIPLEFRNESGRETDKAEAFADDTTGLTILELESLSKLKQALFDFGEMSGLKCNVEKTVLMQVGNLIAPSNEILALGFSHVESIRILGMDIDQNILNLDQNFSNILDRIRNSISYWKRYNLTLNGRINVIKSLLVSLINHLGCILMPSRQILNSLQKEVDDFTIGKLNVAKNRICL